MKEKMNKLKTKAIKSMPKIKKGSKKMLKQIWGYLKTNILLEVFLLVNVINGIILRGFTVNNIWSIKPIIADLTFLLLLGAFSYLFKPKRRIWYLFICTIFCSTICIINSVYYRNYISFASISMLSTASELTGYDQADSMISGILEIKDFIFFIQPFILLFVHIQLKRKKYYEKVAKIEVRKKRILNGFALTIISLGVFITQVTSTDISRLNKQWNRASIVMEFGIYTYQLNDAVSCIKTQVNTMFGYDEAAKNFREYYASKEPHKDNEYTNMFEGKNVLVIHAESFQSFAMNLRFNDKDLTPNMNRIADEGIYFNNFYSEESTGTSSDSEFTFASSLLPANHGTVFMNYFNRDYNAIQKLMKEKGYYTFAMHGNNGSAWNRDVMYKYLGYEKFYSKKDYEIDEEIGIGLSDKSFFRQSVEKLKTIDKENDKWYGTLIMLTNHTPFSDIVEHSNYSVDITLEDGTVAPYLENTKIGNYLKGVNYADEAINELFNELEEAGLLDDTIIVIYGDHDAKLKKSEFNKLYNNELADKVLIDPSKKIVEMDDFAYELNRKVPFIIWSKDIKEKEKNKTISDAMGMIDIAPTIENMLGVTNKYALGHDMFSDNDKIVVFPSGNWMTNDVYYNSSKKEYRQLRENASVSIEQINKYNEYSEKIISISNGIIDYDLIKKANENDGQLLETSK